MRTAVFVILLSLATTAAAAQALPVPPADTPPIGIVHLPGGAARATAAGDSASWVWSVPEYCMSYTSSSGVVTRLIAASGMWVETIDVKLSDMMNAICASGRNYAIYMTWAGNSAYWNQLLLPAR